MELKKPKFTITRRKESVIVTIHGNQFDQNICFNCYGGTHRSVFNSFADELMRQKTLNIAGIYTIVKSYDRKHVNTMGVTSIKPGISNKSGCKIFF